MKLASRSGGPHKLESETQVFRIDTAGAATAYSDASAAGMVAGDRHADAALLRAKGSESMDADAALVIAGVVHHPDEGCCCSGPLANDGWRWRFLLANTCRRSSWRLWHTMEPASVPGPYYDVDSASGPMRNFSTLLYSALPADHYRLVSARAFQQDHHGRLQLYILRGDGLCYVCLSQTHNGCRDNNSLSTRPVKCALCEGTSRPKLLGFCRMCSSVVQGSRCIPMSTHPILNPDRNTRSACFWNIQRACNERPVSMLAD
jgi:hypothetical protein